MRLESMRLVSVALPPDLGARRSLKDSNHHVLSVSFPRSNMVQEGKGRGRISALAARRCAPWQRRRARGGIRVDLRWIVCVWELTSTPRPEKRPKVKKSVGKGTCRAAAGAPDGLIDAPWPCARALRRGLGALGALASRSETIDTPQGTSMTYPENRSKSSDGYVDSHETHSESWKKRSHIYSTAVRLRTGCEACTWNCCTPDT